MSFRTKLSVLGEGERTNLVHVLQRERGVTCGWVASGGGVEFESLLGPQRSFVDEVANSSIRTSLVNLRTAADDIVRRATDQRRAFEWRRLSFSSGCSLPSSKSNSPVQVTKDRNISTMGDMKDSMLSVNSALNQLSALRACLAQTKDPNTRDPDGDRTPLHWAAARGHTKCALALLKAGADPLIRETSTGLTCPELAESRGYCELAVMLSQTEGSHASAADAYSLLLAQARERSPAAPTRLPLPLPHAASLPASHAYRCLRTPARAPGLLRHLHGLQRADQAVP